MTNQYQLQVLKRSGTPQERGYAEQIATVSTLQSLHPDIMHSSEAAHDYGNSQQALHDICPGTQLVSRPHHLLVTLVLINASATEALPLCLDRLYSPAGALRRAR